MPLCPIVNDQDQIIGYKDRRELDSQDAYYRAAGLWLTNSKGQILIAQRHKNKAHHPGKWGPAAAGTVEQNETYESNIYKEAEEEIGLIGISFKIGPKMRTETPHKHFTQWYSAICDWPLDRFLPQSTEVERVMWIDKNELEKDLSKNPNKYTPSMPAYLGYYS